MSRASVLLVGQGMLRSRPVQENDGLPILHSRPSEDLRACHQPTLSLSNYGGARTIGGALRCPFRICLSQAQKTLLVARPRSPH